MPPLRSLLHPSRAVLLRTSRLPAARSFATSIHHRNRQQTPPSQSQSPSPTAPAPDPDPDSDEPPRYNFYRTHGRAFFKALTLAFLTMQLAHWSWLVLETEEERDAKNAQIRALEGEVRLLDEGRWTHRLEREGKSEEGGDAEEGKEA